MIILNWNNIEIPEWETSWGITRAKERDSLIMSPRPRRMVQEEQGEEEEAGEVEFGFDIWVVMEWDKVLSTDLKIYNSKYDQVSLAIVFVWKALGVIIILRHPSIHVESKD